MNSCHSLAPKRHHGVSSLPDPALIEDPAPFTVGMSKYQKQGELLKNSVESYSLLDKIVLVMKDLVWVEQAVAMGGR